MNTIVKYLLVALTFACTNIIQAQNSFQEKLQELFEVNQLIGGNQINNENKSNYSQLLQSMGKSEKEADSLCTVYFETQFMKDAVAVVSPYYEKVMNEADLDDLIKQSKTEKVQAALANITKATQKMQSDIEGQLQPYMVAIQKGEPVQPITAEACSDSYKEAFNKFYKASGSEAAVNTAKDLMVGLMEWSLSMAKTEEKKIEGNKMVQTIKTVFDDFETISRNLFYPEISEQDMNTVTEVFESPAGKKVRQANEAMTEDVMTIGTESLKKFTDWVGTQK